jgi:hypothetical protein
MVTLIMILSFEFSPSHLLSPEISYSLQTSPSTIGWPTFHVIATLSTSPTLLYDSSRVLSTCATDHASSSTLSYALSTMFQAL